MIPPGLKKNLPPLNPKLISSYKLSLGFALNLGQPLLWLMLTIVLSQSCGFKHETHILTKKWHVVKIDVLPHDSLRSEIYRYQAHRTPEDAPQITYTFLADSTYEIKIGNQHDRGLWKMSTDYKVLILRSDYHEEDDAEFLIDFMADHQLRLISEESGIREVMFLEPVRE